MADTDAQGQRWPQPEKPVVRDTRPNGLEVNAAFYSINDKALGAGEPIRVRAGQRVLFHLLNASAIENRSIALSGHQFHVLALDGNPVPSPQPVDQIVLGSGERVDAYVEMNRPGVWIMGAPENNIRNAGLGVVIEYANQLWQPEWIPPGPLAGTTRCLARRPQASPLGADAGRDNRDDCSRRCRARSVSSTAFWSTASRTRTIGNSCCIRAVVTVSCSATGPTTRIRCICIDTFLNWSRSTERRRPAS